MAFVCRIHDTISRYHKVNSVSAMEKIKLALLRCNNFVKTHTFWPGNSDQNDFGDDRYAVCKLLASKNITSVIWLEDLLALHGSKTAVWDLHLLVEDTSAAAKILLDNGYKETAPDSSFEDDPEFSDRAIRLTHNCSSTIVMLHAAKEWYYQMDDNVQDFLPPLSSFLDSMIEFWINISAQDYDDRLRFALYIGCLIGYCYYLQDSDGQLVKTHAYAENLKPEHREVHYDITFESPNKKSFTATDRHTYHVRRSREIREGAFVPKPYEEGVFRTNLTTVSEQE
ncbi:hypothetical protein BOTNAR_0020g00520 [Botryotinia narcissicola]|uniref:Uncharacterized protein n=1 Tax=Botryotinia narcissicola TaxID=278944 RepID=A0A4Z1J588_9HELO|nr:hypothetical protein BOTNAR_0020g00520 [Botryotinia narcissicola]